MNKLIVAAIRCCLMFPLPTVTYAISAQWDLDPTSGDWNTAANWTPMGIPNGPADIATFALSNTTNVFISANTELSGITFTSAATNPYLIAVSPGVTLTLSGAGITNNSGIAQSFLLDSSLEGRQIRFTNTASAGNANIANYGDSSVQFLNRSTAGSATIDNGGSVNFFNRSTAGSATIYNTGSVNFFDTSTAGSATIGLIGLTNYINFYDHSTSGNATLDPGELGYITFRDHSTAGDATIFGGPVGFIEFSDFSTAGSATISANGAFMVFSGSSKGGTAAIGLFFHVGLQFPSNLDISFHNAPGVTIGSLEGDETATVFLGDNNLTVGSNNLSTTFSGVIQDGFSGDTGGSLTKIGTGTLILSGANTYTGNTNVNRGVLQVDGSITSNTFVNNKGTLAGTGTVHGNVMSNGFGTVRPGGAVGAPGVLTVVGNYTQTQFATLLIQMAGANAGQFSVLNVLGSANVNGYLGPVLLGGFIPSIGDEFTFLNYGSLSGTFRLKNGGVFNNGTERWVVTYGPTEAVLTATKNVPDQGSTFLLLTLGLLGLVAYRRQLLRGQL